MGKIPWNKILDHWPAKMLSIAAALLLFFFNRVDNMNQKSFNVTLRLMTDTTLVPAENYNHRVKIIVRGNDEVIASLNEDDLEAVADFTDRSNEGIYRAPIKITKKGTFSDADNMEILVIPLDITLRLEKKETKTVKVQPIFSGQPNHNYELSNYEISPEYVTVEGPRTKIDRLQGIRTEAIDLRGKTDDFTLKLRLLPDSSLITFPAGNTVLIKGKMKTSLSLKEMNNIPIEVLNMAPNLQLKTPLPQANLKIRGTPAELENLGGTKVTLDLTGYSAPGELIDLPLQAMLPSGVELVSLSPGLINVTLEAKQ